MRKHPNSHREANATAPVLDSTRHSLTWICWCNRSCQGIQSQSGSGSSPSEGDFDPPILLAVIRIVTAIRLRVWRHRFRVAKALRNR